MGHDKSVIYQQGDTLYASILTITKYRCSTYRSRQGLGTGKRERKQTHTEYFNDTSQQVSDLKMTV